MWTKDYLVRGFIKRRRQRRAIERYESEWQALYRVEGARRALKQARAKAAEDRRIVLAWDVAELRKKIEAAEREAARVGNPAEREKLKKIRDERWEKEAAKISAEAKAALSPDQIWMAWAWANGQRQTEAARHLGCRNSTAVSLACRQYVFAHYPENLYYDERYNRVAHHGDRHALVKLALGGKPEPLRPRTWAPVPLRPKLPRPKPPRSLPSVPDGVPKGPQEPSSARGWREVSDARIRWVLSQRRAGFTLQQVADALGLGRERIRQMQAKAEEREARAAEALWLWYEARAVKGLGRPLDIDANREDYRGKWLTDD